MFDVGNWELFVPQVPLVPLVSQVPLVPLVPFPNSRLPIPAVLQYPLINRPEHRVAIGVHVVRLLPSLPQRRRAALDHVKPAREALVKHYLASKVDSSVLRKIHEHIAR